MSDDDTRRRRLFFALWPDERTRARLARVARQWSRHPVAAANLHMTLHFLGACTLEQQQCYSKAVSGIKFKPFELKLNYLGGWARSRIQWLGASEFPPALDALVAALGAALAECGYQPDKQHFVPHVTLSRSERNPRFKAALAEVDWLVSDFVLAESVAGDDGVHYLVRERWRGCD